MQVWAPHRWHAVRAFAGLVNGSPWASRSGPSAAPPVVDECPERHRGVPPLRVVEIEPRERRRERLEHGYELAARHLLAHLVLVEHRQAHPGARQSGEYR